MRHHAATAKRSAWCSAASLALLTQGKEGMKARSSKRAPCVVRREAPADWEPAFALTVRLDRSALGVPQEVGFEYRLPLGEAAQPPKRQRTEADAAHLQSTQEQAVWSQDGQVLTCSGVLELTTQVRQYTA